MSAKSSDLGERLSELVSSARESVVVVAPFIKKTALSRVLRDLRTPEFVCVTRWLPGEIAVGVCDIEIYDVVTAIGGSLWLRQDLHAKYFRGDARALVGSANVTQAALGWTTRPNLELLIEHDATAHGLPAFERSLMASAVSVDDDICSQVATAVEAVRESGIEQKSAFSELTFAERSLVDPSLKEIDIGRWIPHLRQPTQLFRAYQDPADDSIASLSKEAAISDLAMLNPPVGLDKPNFERTIAGTILTFPVVQAVDRYVINPRPFGIVRALLQDRLQCNREEAEASLQTLIRWLLHFLPERYCYDRPRHSEIFSRRS